MLILISDEVFGFGGMNHRCIRSYWFESEYLNGGFGNLVSPTFCSIPTKSAAFWCPALLPTLTHCDPRRPKGPFLKVFYSNSV